MLILNTSWMRDYRGVSGDRPIGKFGYMKGGGVPHEVYNFAPIRGRYYGYAPVRNGCINIKRLGAGDDDYSIGGQDVVWTATHPAGGRYVVGWFRNATVLGESRRRPGRDGFYYNVTATQKDGRILSLDERVLRIPTMQKGFPGTSSSFFADELPLHWRSKLSAYLESGGGSSKATSGARGTPRSVDPERRAAVELAAVRAVTRHYQRLGFAVTSREKDNVGWDLDAVQGDLLLRLEVKGCSGKNVAVEVTPNEYAAMTSRGYRASYRLCIVTNALVNPLLQIFAHDAQTGIWSEEDGRTLTISPRTGAAIRCG